MTGPSAQHGNAGRILVTPRSLTARGIENVPELDCLREAGYELIASEPGRAPSEHELLELVPDAIGWLAGVEPIGARVLEAAGRLRAISRNGAGIDNIDGEAARAAGVAVLRAPGANANGVAELTLTLCLAALRHIPSSSSALHAGRWSRQLGRELGETTVGIVGLGAVGRRVANRFALLGASVIGYDPFVTEADLPLVTLDELLGRADVVTLHCPPAADGRPLLDAAAVATLAPGAVLINTARSTLVDDDAVLAALETDRLSIYAVDAFDREPPEPSALIAHERVIATPHLGGYTVASVSRAARQAAENLREALDEERS
jgi:D-3-phosphoglycerate dehydrogenase